MCEREAVGVNGPCEQAEGVVVVGWLRRAEEGVCPRRRQQSDTATEYRESGCQGASDRSSPACRGPTGPPRATAEGTHRRSPCRETQPGTRERGEGRKEGGEGDAEDREPERTTWGLAGEGARGELAESRVQTRVASKAKKKSASRSAECTRYKRAGAEDWLCRITSISSSSRRHLAPLSTPPPTDHPTPCSC